MNSYNNFWDFNEKTQLISGHLKHSAQTPKSPLLPKYVSFHLAWPLNSGFTILSQPTMDASTEAYPKQT